MIEITLEQLDEIVAAAEPSPGGRSSMDQYCNVASAIGDLRPAADLETNHTPTRDIYERNEMWKMMLDLQTRSKRQVEGKPPEDYPEYLAIPKPPREISTVLEIEWLQIFTLIVSGQYEKPVQKRFLIETLRVYSEWVCKTDGTIDKTVEVPEGFSLPMPTNPEELTNIPNLNDRRKKLVEYWLKSDDFDCEDLRNYILTVEYRSLPTEIYIHFISEFIQGKLESEKNKRGYDLLRYFPDLPITIGIEAEIPTIYTNLYHQSHKIDPLQQLGIPVTYELPVENIVRELPLPYSYGLQNQIRALAELFLTKILPDGYFISLHINIGELGTKIDEDIFYFQEALLMGDVMDMASRFKESGHLPSLVFKEGGRKPLFSDQRDGPKGLPFKQREDFTTLELRSGVIIHGAIPEIAGNSAKSSNLFHCVKDSANLAAMTYALIGHRRSQIDPNNVQLQMLSEAWLSFKKQIIDSQTMCSDRATAFHKLYKESGNSMEKLEDRYSKLQAELVMKVNSDTWYKIMNPSVRRALQKLRKDVRKALVPATDRVTELSRTGLLGAS